MKNEQKHHGVMVPESAYHRVVAVATKLDFSLAHLLRNAIAEYCQEHGETLIVDTLKFGP